MLELTIHETPKPSVSPYTTPHIVYEGDLEIQAGSPLAVPDLADFEDYEW